MPIQAIRGKVPRLGERVFLAPGAWVIGDVSLGDDVSFWFQTAARGDVQSITIGARCNIQDGSILHVTHDTHPLVLGDDVVIGHSSVVHGCTVMDRALVGIGATVLDGAIIEEGAQIAAGALVTPGKVIPAGWLALGVPARPVRELTPEEREANAAISQRYVALQAEYRAQMGAGTAVGAC